MLAQSHGRGGPKRRSELLTHLLAAHFRPPSPDSWLLLAAMGREDTRPRNRERRLGDPEPRGASGLVSSHNTPERDPSTQPSPWPFLLSWAGSEQMGSREADPLPQPRGCSEWRVVSGKGGEPRPCEGRLLAPQTHVVGLKKLLGSEALAGVRPALAPERGRADAEAVSSAPLAFSPEGPQDSRRTGDPHSAGEWGEPWGRAGGAGSWGRFWEELLSEDSRPEARVRDLCGQGR